MKKIISVLAIASVFAVSCNTSADRQREAMIQQQQRTIDSINMELARQRVIDSMNKVARVENEAREREARQSRRSSGRLSRSSSQGSYAQSQPVYNTVNESQPVSAGETEQKKKGWSAKATGAVVGAGAGAITGAAVSKNKKGQGAIIGGIIGAGTGLGVGAIIDKKKGR